MGLRTAACALLVGVVVIGVLRFGPVLIGWPRFVDETQCVREEGAAVCVDRRGTELELKANGLLPGSNLNFDGEPIPVGPAGNLEGRYFFATNAFTLQGPIDIEARTASGWTFVGSVEFWER